jgi:hypothetical protein
MRFVECLERVAERRGRLGGIGLAADDLHHVADLQAQAGRRASRTQEHAAARAFILTPRCRRAAKKPGPSCRPMANTKRISPNSLTNASVHVSTGFPKCPVTMPAKSTPAVPRPTPRTVQLPSPMPATHTSASTPTACATGYVV